LYFKPNGFGWSSIFGGSATDGIMEDGTDSVRTVALSDKAAEESMNSCFFIVHGCVEVENALYHADNEAM
jgi:hypothetical protein